MDHPAFKQARTDWFRYDPWAETGLDPWKNVYENLRCTIKLVAVVIL